MKAYYNGITLEGTPEEVAQCIKAMKERDYSYLHDAAFNEEERIRKQWEDHWKVNQNCNTIAYLTSTGPIFGSQMTDEQRKAYMDAWANNPD